MAKKQDYLGEICISYFGRGMHPKMNEVQLLQSGYYDEVSEMYKTLGGVLPDIPMRVGKYDIDTGGFIIEFDEENHFNRYRLLTLNSVIYKGNKNLDISKYRLFCEQNENRCCTFGKYWETSSTQKQFGRALIDGSFGDNAPSRWKQRAFYDFIKDVTSIVLNVPILRISIYDQYNGYTIERLIKEKQERILIKYIEERLKLVK